MNDTEFTNIDRMVFDRLHRGSLAPLTLRLKDGTRLTGQIVAIHRSGATGSAQEEPGGEIRLDANGRLVSVGYDQISGIE